MNKTKNLFIANRLKIKIYIKWLLFISMFPFIAILVKGNSIGDMYLKNPLTMLGVVTGGITALITMLIFIINFNINDVYLGKSKSKAYLEDRVLIQFLKSRIFKFIFFIFLVVTLKLCGIVFKETYIYQVLDSIKLFNSLLDIIEKYYISAGIFSFLILSSTTLLAIMGNIEQLFHTMKFKEDEMLYLKYKIEYGISKQYKKLFEYREYRGYFFYMLTKEYKIVKEDEKKKFLQVVFKFFSNGNFKNNNDSFIKGMTVEELEEFLNNKYYWIQENVSDEEFLEKSLLEDIVYLSYFDKSKINRIKVGLGNRDNHFREKECDIRIALIEKFIKLKKQEEGNFIQNLMEKVIRVNKLSEDTEFVEYIFKKVISNLVKVDKLENDTLYKLLSKSIYTTELKKLKNEVLVAYLFDKNINYLGKEKYKELLNLLSEEYKISWALYKIFEEKYRWSKNVEFAFEVLYRTDLESVESYYYNIVLGARKQMEVLEVIVSILDKSRLNYRMRDKYEFIFENLDREVNYEFEETLKERDIDIFKFILIREWLNKNNINYYLDETEYFSGDIENNVLINNIFYKLLLYVNHMVIQKDRYITELIYILTVNYQELIIKNIYYINDWKILMYLEMKLNGSIEMHFNANNQYIRSNSTLAYFNVLLDKKTHKELYLDKKFKKVLYNSLAEYMRTNNKTLQETINEFKQYRSLSGLEEQVLKREFDEGLIV